MALIFNDRVRETSTTTGTGTLTLSGAPTGFQTFSTGIGNGNTCYYTIQTVDVNGVPTGDWEVGLGTVGVGTLARDTIYQSSNSDSLVSFSGLLQVYITIPSEYLNTILPANFIRKDGTTTTTATIPFAQNLSTSKITNLTTNGLAYTSAGDGTLNILADSGIGTYVLTSTNGTKAWSLQITPSAPSWASVLAVGRTSSGVNPQLTTTDRLEIRDASNYIGSTSSNIIDIVGAGTVNITAPTALKLASLTTNGFLTTSGSNGTVGVTLTSAIDHNSLNNLTVGDVHTQYAYKPGKSGGQTLIGGTGVTDALILQGTTGNGTSTTQTIKFAVGNNGATQAASIDNQGKFVIGAGTATTNGSVLQLVNNGVNGMLSFVADANAANANLFLFRRSRGTTSSPTAVSSGDMIMGITGQGFDSGGTPTARNSVQIAMMVDGTVSSGNVPGRLVFNTVAVGGGTTLVNRQFIASNGQIVTGMSTTQAAIALSNEQFIMNAQTATDNVHAVLGLQDSDLPTAYSGDLARWGVYDLFSTGGGTPGEVIYTKIDSQGELLLRGNPVTRVLSTTTGINAKSTGTTTLYTVPTGKTAIITQATVRCTAASAITVGPTLGIGVAAGESDIYASTALTGLINTTTANMFGFTTVGMSVTAAAAAAIKVGIDVASTGTSQTIAIDLIGYLI